MARRLSLALLLCGASLAHGQGTRLSIYAPSDFEPEMFASANDTLTRSDLPGYASVRERITLDLARGINAVRFAEVPRKLDAASVTLAPINPPKTLRILSQQFENDVVNPARLLDLYIGRRIQLDTSGRSGERVVGTLLGVAEGVTLKTDDGQVRTYREYASITFADIPGGLITRPSLIWQVDSPDVAFQAAELSYLTAGISWWADYTVTLAAGPKCRATVTAWANIANASGKSFSNATIELKHARAQMFKGRSGTAQAETFALERPTDLPTGSVRQLPLLPPAQDYACERVVALESSPAWRPSAPITKEPDPASTSAGALRQLRVLSLNQGGRSIILPSGRLRLQQQRENGAIDLLAWDRIKPRGRDNMMKIDLAREDAISITRKVNDFALDAAAGVMEEAIELKLSNAPAEPTEIRVKENLYRWRSWAVSNASLPFERVSANAIEFKLTLGAKANAEIRFVVRYRFTPPSS